MGAARPAAWDRWLGVCGRRGLLGRRSACGGLWFEVGVRLAARHLGHRGRKDDLLYRARRLLIPAHERLTERGDAKLRGLLAAGDPHVEVRLA